MTRQHGRDWISLADICNIHWKEINLPSKSSYHTSYALWRCWYVWCLDIAVCERGRFIKNYTLISSIMADMAEGITCSR